MGMPTRVVAMDMELRGDIFLEGWLVTAFVRYAPFGGYFGGRKIPAFAYDEIAVGVGAGQRVALGEIGVVDLSIAPELVVMEEEGDVPADGTAGSDDEMRLVATARLVLTRSPWHPTLTLDAEIAPFAAAHPAIADVNLPSLPTWTAGLRVGIARDFL